MSYGIVAMAGMAALGGIQANEQQQNQRRQNQGAAEQTRYSNWTGRAGQSNFGAPSVFGGALGGAVSGAKMGQSFGGFKGYGDGAGTGTTANMHGGQGLSAQAAPGQSPYGSLVRQPQKTLYQP